MLDIALELEMEVEVEDGRIEHDEFFAALGSDDNIL